MKYILGICLFFLIEDGYGQFYDMSHWTAYESNWNGHRHVSLESFNNDKYGNCFSVVRERICLPCYRTSTLKWSGPSGSGSFKFPGNSQPSLKMYGDVFGNVFALGTFTSAHYPTIFGSYLNTSLGKKALIKIGNPSWALVIDAVSISVSDSGYCFTINADTVKLYSPAGVLLWTRAGGGTQVYAFNDLSYLVHDGSTITRYHSNGSVQWQESFADSFQVNSAGQIVVKQAADVYLLDPSNGQTTGTHAGATQGTVFDNEGNGYIYYDSILVKYDSSGMVWKTHLTGTDFANVGFDMYNNIYFANSYVSHTEDNSYNATPYVYLYPRPCISSRIHLTACGRNIMPPIWEGSIREPR